MGRAFHRDDRAVNEVIGYVLSFAISAVFLLISLQVFHSARGNTEDVVTAVELKAIADRVSSRVVEAGMISQEFPNATLNLTVDIPVSLHGRPYQVTASEEEITVATADGSLSATSTTFKMDAYTNVVVSGIVQSSSERVIVHYESSGAARLITIRGD